MMAMVSETTSRDCPTDEPVLPTRLKSGDEVGIIAPAYPGPAVFPTRFERGLQVLRSMGLRVRVGHYVRTRTGNRTGSIEQRASDLNEMFADPNIAGIFCAMGGEGCREMLPFCDFSLIARNPKVFVGYSDVTHLHLAIHARTQLTTFHGPSVLAELGEYPEPFSYTLHNLLNAIWIGRRVVQWTHSHSSTCAYWETAPDEERRSISAEAACWNWLRDGTGSGRMIGGLLPAISNLLGTTYLPNFRNTILFWEAVDTTVAIVANHLRRLKEYGVLQELAGMVVGKCILKDDPNHTQLNETLRSILGQQSYPILANVDLGHTEPKITIPIGQAVRLCSETNVFAPVVRD